MPHGRPSFVSLEQKFCPFSFAASRYHSLHKWRCIIKCVCDGTRDRKVCKCLARLLCLVINQSLVARHLALPIVAASGGLAPKELRVAKGALRVRRSVAGSLGFRQHSACLVDYSVFTPFSHHLNIRCLQLKIFKYKCPLHLKLSIGNVRSRMPFFQISRTL